MNLLALKPLTIRLIGKENTMFIIIISSKEHDEVKNEMHFSPFEAYTANDYKADYIFLQLMLNKRKSRILIKEKKEALIIII